MLKLTDDERALLSAVAADRDADLPRLVYADWLDDRGRPDRAEFIRLQCAFEAAAGNSSTALPAFADGWSLDERARRFLDLHRTHGPAWLRELPRWAVADGPPAFRRGFVEDADVPAAQFVRYGPQLLDRTPLRRLRLAHPRGVWADVLRCGWLREVPALDLGGGRLTDAELAGLGGADWLAGTARLNLGGNHARDATARTLAACRHLRGLRHLDLSANDLTLAGARSLAESPYLTHLRSLNLGWNPHLGRDREAVLRLFADRTARGLRLDV
jgi:uncharacterized protein (TIGR02996 family)